MLAAQQGALARCQPTIVDWYNAVSFHLCGPTVLRFWTTGLLLTLLALPARAECPLELRSYEDLDGRGLVLEFDPPATDLGMAVIAIASIRHPDRGEIGRFEVIASLGDGNVSLGADERDHAIYFFTEDLRSTRTAEGSSLLFAEGLGLADWQVGELPGSREHPLGDALWRMQGCKE